MEKILRNEEGGLIVANPTRNHREPQLDTSHLFHQTLGEGETEEPWLVSYADLMTLLFGFFAMLFTYASFEDTTNVKVNANVARYFGGNYVSPIEKMSKDIKFVLGKSPYQNDMDLKVVEDGLEVSFITSVLFESGSSDLIPSAVPALDILINLILTAEKESMIRIEGHTDDTPMSSTLFPSNWELSAARAAALARKFEKSGLPSERLSISGYGSSRPAFPNRDEQGQAIPLNQSRNRRVVVKVILPKGQKKNTQLAPKQSDKVLVE